MVLRFTSLRFPLNASKGLYAAVPLETKSLNIPLRYCNMLLKEYALRPPLPYSSRRLAACLHVKFLHSQVEIPCLSHQFVKKFNFDL